MTNISSFSFDPISATVTEGGTLTVDVLMYSGSDPIISTDVWISYNPEILTPITEGEQAVIGGDFFQITDAKIVSPGKMYLYAINQSPANVNTTNGKLASIRFKARKTGTTELHFDCIPFHKQTSQIIKYDAELSNVINCRATRAHSSSVVVKSENVLGASTQNSYQTGYIVLAILLVVFTGVLYLRYKRLGKHLKIS